jgi:hypothetical protein
MAAGGGHGGRDLGTAERLAWRRRCGEATGSATSTVGEGGCNYLTPNSDERFQVQGN